jgi:hypothetical protein
MKMEEFQPGVRVFAILKVEGEPATKTSGMVGNAWGEGGPKLIVKFDGKGWVYINEKNAPLFQLEPTN